MDTKLFDLPLNGDNRGNLVVVEGADIVPFEIKRLFYIYGCDNSSIRGQHANKKSKFAFICLKGRCKVRIKDGRNNSSEYTLDNPKECLYIPEMTWKEMYDFSSDCVLLVISSEHYDSKEYISNYEEFKKAVS